MRTLYDEAGNEVEVPDEQELEGLKKATEESEKLKEQMKDRKSTRLNSSHIPLSRMPSSA